MRKIFKIFFIRGWNRLSQFCTTYNFAQKGVCKYFCNVSRRAKLYYHSRQQLPLGGNAKQFVYIGVP